LSDNYDRLVEVSYNTIAGLGFVDLDFDAQAEMVLFDAGASASMGVSVFDIVNGKVVCVSAHMTPIGEAFGTNRLSHILICANFMVSFRLLENTATGERFFIVESANADAEESYSEVVRFGSDNGALTLSSVFHKTERRDPETGEATGASYSVGSIEAYLSGYTSFVDNFYAENIDLGLECGGAFVWEHSDYVENYDNFMALADEALALIPQNRLN
jgi:hypothetical protein